MPLNLEKTPAMHYTPRTLFNNEDSHLAGIFDTPPHVREPDRREFPTEDDLDVSAEVEEYEQVRAQVTASEPETNSKFETWIYDVEDLSRHTWRHMLLAVPNMPMEHRTAEMCNEFAEWWRATEQLPAYEEVDTHGDALPEYSVLPPKGLIRDYYQPKNTAAEIEARRLQNEAVSARQFDAFLLELKTLSSNAGRWGWMQESGVNSFEVSCRRGDNLMVLTMSLENADDVDYMRSIGSQFRPAEFSAQMETQRQRTNRRIEEERRQEMWRHCDVLNRLQSREQADAALQQQHATEYPEGESLQNEHEEIQQQRVIRAEEARRQGDLLRQRLAEVRAQAPIRQEELTRHQQIALQNLTRRPIGVLYTRGGERRIFPPEERNDEPREAYRIPQRREARPLRSSLVRDAPINLSNTYALPTQQPQPLPTQGQGIPARLWPRQSPFDPRNRTAPRVTAYDNPPASQQSFREYRGRSIHPRQASRQTPQQAIRDAPSPRTRSVSQMTSSLIPPTPIIRPTEMHEPDDLVPVVERYAAQARVERIANQQREEHGALSLRPLSLDNYVEHRNAEERETARVEQRPYCALPLLFPDDATEASVRSLWHDSDDDDEDDDNSGD